MAHVDGHESTPRIRDKRTSQEENPPGWLSLADGLMHQHKQIDYEAGNGHEERGHSEHKLHPVRANSEPRNSTCCSTSHMVFSCHGQ